MCVVFLFFSCFLFVCLVLCFVSLEHFYVAGLYHLINWHCSSVFCLFIMTVAIWNLPFLLLSLLFLPSSVHFLPSSFFFLHIFYLLFHFFLHHFFSCIFNLPSLFFFPSSCPFLIFLFHVFLHYFIFFVWCFLVFGGGCGVCVCCFRRPLFLSVGFFLFSFFFVTHLFSVNFWSKNK